MAKKTTDVNNYLLLVLVRVLCKLDAAFGVWLWPQLRYVVCIRQVTFVSIFQKDYINIIRCVRL